MKTSALWQDTPFATQVHAWKEQEWVELVDALLQQAALWGYAQKQAVTETLPGWRLKASALEWRLLDETTQANAFFRQLYLNVAELLRREDHPFFDFEAQEHTAQVDPARRQWLEQRFRFTAKDRQDWADNPGHETPLERLPVMFCSPTMELGVDISALNTVYLRNVPPTPANYAQRSGRAGRSGQQALVITYCAALSPHDQWFFHHATDMVHGIVKAPTLDLANRDLVESHLHAVWLASAQVGLDTSIAPLLDLEQADKPVQPDLWARLNHPEVQVRAQAAAAGVMAQLATDLPEHDWFTPAQVRETIRQAPQRFSAALQRWRVLFDATRTQMDMADQIIKSHATTPAERTNAQRRYGDAARQYAILLKSGNTQNTDFYSYRFLASQGFLPGYNFPRLPLMAWIPAGGGGKAQDDEGSMVSRPRFLALAEFGPRSLIYHQGRMYRVVRAKLNVGSADHITGNSQLATLSSLVCGQCGYGHLGAGQEPAQLNCCENCGALLTESDWVRELYRVETVETLRTDRISVNDEDRQRQGYELQTTYRFMPGPDNRVQKHQAEVRQGEETLAGLTYAPAARIWRINRGWRRRKDKNQLGFYINPITGTWSKQDDPNANEATDSDEPMLDRVPNQRIVPFVQDHRNLLILTPLGDLSTATMATLQAALKRGIELTFQIEESELVAEPLPTQDARKGLLFYEAAEGGAGVLTRLAGEPDSLAQVAANALTLMHFTPPAGPWHLDQLEALEMKADNGQRPCEAGCYQCLLSYFNQPDHVHINRRDPDALRLLVALANAQVVEVSADTRQPPGAEPGTGPDLEPNTGLGAGPGAELGIAAGLDPGLDALAEHDRLAAWLTALHARGLQPPDATRIPVQGGQATAAGQYKGARTLIFLEPLPDAVRDALTDKGWQALDFSTPEQWPALFQQHSAVFGDAHD